MPCLTCNWDAWRALSKAAAKAASARVRAIGLSRFDDQWTKKATICEGCPLRVVYRKTSYCGSRFSIRCRAMKRSMGADARPTTRLKTPVSTAPSMPGIGRRSGWARIAIANGVRHAHVRPCGNSHSGDALLDQSF